MTLRVTLSDSTRLVPQWRAAGPFASWQGNAKAHARSHGTACVVRADGSMVRYYMHGRALRRTTYRQVVLDGGAPAGDIEAYPNTQATP